MPIPLRFPRLTLAALGLLAATGARATVTDDTVDPAHLIAAYHQAVIGHDGARLTALFVPTGSAWFSVLSDRAWAQARVAKPETPKLRPGSLAGFASMVANPKLQLDPEHSNMHITSDGEIAAVTFDFRFLINGKEENRGAESWQLVRTADGWRIASIVFSSTPPSVPG